MYMFINDIIKTLSYDDISVSVTQKDSFDSGARIENFTLAFGVSGFTEE